MSVESFRESEAFVPAPGLASPHAQTIFAHLRRRRSLPPVERQHWTTADGDFVEVDVADVPGAAATVLVLHGLEGSSKAGYVAAVMRGARHLGLRAAALNFRGCGGEANRLARSYHSGDTGDAAMVADELARRHGVPVWAVGFSLGANVLLKLLAETGSASPVRAAVAISTPYDLAACAGALDAGAGLGAVYRWRFLGSLIAKARAKALAHPGSIDLERLRRVRTIVAFDEVVTAPLHGFASAAAYYADSSSGPRLGEIRVPTLLVSAADDPLVPVAVPRTAHDNPCLRVLVTPRGGHVGFVAGSIARPRFWADEQALAFLASHRS